MNTSKASSSDTTTPQAPIILLDGDLYLYRAAAAAEQEIDWGDDIWSLSTDLKDAKEVFKTLVDELRDFLQTDNLIVCLSDIDNFRHELYVPYKSGRRKTRKPVGYKALVEWAKETYKFSCEPLLEADDVMGILGTNKSIATIVVSDDKDMKTVPCTLYRPMSAEMLTITEEEADRNFLLQTLTGDITDGYKGCPNVGIKTAEKILGPRPSWAAVVAAYQKAGMTESQALTQARCARILRRSNWDASNRTIKLWEPA